MSTDKTDRNGALHDGKNGQFKSKSADELKNELVIVIEDKKPVIFNPSTKLEDKEYARIPFDYFGKKRKQPIRQYNSVDIPTCPAEAFEFSRLDTEHHNRHREEMGYKTLKDYQEGAVEFWNNGKGDIFYSKPRNSFYKYNKQTTQLLVISSNGIIHTFMYYTNNKFISLSRWEKLERYDKI